MDEHCEGRPPSVVTEKNVSTVEKLIMQDRRITVKQLAFETKISIGSVETILHDHLNLNKVSARWVPRTPHICNGEDPHHPHQRKQRSHNQVERSCCRVSGTVIIITTDYMEKGKTVTGEYYLGLLKRLRSELARRRRGKLQSGVLLLHDNAPAHRARQTVETAGRCDFEILPHPPYSPDLAPSAFCLFPNLKKSIKERRFEDITDAITAIEQGFQAQSDTFYSQGL
ncbi:transposase [Elysia marginata]|uniref:Transposase n=1 Tax=Elysia marginata TaxID=1093978 RepID=A0AAV4JMR2_9GAST|nr:transposase [Elysia marginata]